MDVARRGTDGVQDVARGRENEDRKRQGGEERVERERARQEEDLVLVRRDEDPPYEPDG